VSGVFKLDVDLTTQLSGFTWSRWRRRVSARTWTHRSHARSV